MTRSSSGRRAAAVLALAVAITWTPPAAAETTGTPVVGQCTNEQSSESWAHSGDVVDCSGPHTGQTVWVGTWTDSASPSQATAFAPGGVEDTSLREHFMADFDACQAAVASLTGAAKPGYTIVSEFDINFVGPNDAEWAEGQRWSRCDVVAAVPLTRQDVWTLKELPSPQAMAGILNAPLKSNPFRMCFWEGKKGNGFIDCASPFAAYELPVTFDGHDMTWPGSEKKLLKRIQPKCVANPTVRGFGASPGAITASPGTTDKVTKANYKTLIYYCMIKV